MFDLRSTDGSVRRTEAKSPLPTAASPEPVQAHRLDGTEMRDMLHRLLDLYVRELDRQRDNRVEQASDEDFYDIIQWREEDAATVRARGQVPLVYDVISASVDWVTGTQKQSRPDFKVLPRRKEHGKPAERKSQLLKYLADVNREPFHLSRAFEDAVKVGVGWIEDGLQDEAEEEPLYTRYESWRNIVWDSAATERDLSDARYVIRTKWADYDMACAMFPEREAILNQASKSREQFVALDDYGDEVMDSVEMAMEEGTSAAAPDRITGYERRRVRLVECWFRMPVAAPRLKGGAFSGELYDASSPAHVEEVEAGEADAVERTVMRTHVAIFTTAGMLWFSQSPFRHNRYPFTPVWGHVRGRDGMPYGMIRRLRDIQEDINKRASKALHILSTNKVIMEEGALGGGMTMDEFIDEVAHPDAIIVTKPGKKIDFNAERDLADAHLELMSRSIAMIQQASGVTDELMGRRTNATSGIAIQRRQDQGTLATAKYFDNLLFAHQVHGEKLLANIEQFMTEEKQFRITNQRGRPEYVDINDGLPDNDIIRSKADFLISSDTYQATLRQAAAAQLMEVMVQLASVAPQAVLVMLDLVLDSMDIPNREELVKRVRKVTGQSDPDAEEMSEEEQARQQAEARNAALQQASVEAQVRKIVAEALKTEAQARQAASQSVGGNVDALTKALQAAQQAIAIPATVDVADHILAESGFVAASDAAATPSATGAMP